MPKVSTDLLYEQRAEFYRDGAKREQQRDSKIDKLAGDLIDLQARFDRLEARLVAMVAAALSRQPVHVSAGVDWAEAIGLRLDGA